MDNPLTIYELMQQRGLAIHQLADLARLDKRVVEAMAKGQYTSSPQQRERLASALGVSTEEILWGSSVEVDHMYGHGPQFGRSP